MNKFGGLVSGLLGIVIIVLYLCGIGWSVHRNEYGKAVLSFLIPPYGVYQGAISFFRDPQWKEEYDVKSEQIAIAIEYSTSSSQVDRSQSIEENQKLHDWVKQLPEGERAKLKDAAQNYGAAITSCFRTFSTSLLTAHINQHPCQNSETQRRVSGFQNNPSFSPEWKKMVETINADAKNFTTKQQENVIQNDKVTQGKLEAGMKTMESQINTAIADIFN